MKKVTLLITLTLGSLLCFSKSHKTPNTKIDTTLTITIGGIDQYVSIKGENSSNPMLLFLAGGPGDSVIEYADHFTGKLYHKFTVVHWDQRGAGKTLALNPKDTPLSLNLMQKDTHELITYLLTKYNQEKLYLAGLSWGTVLGFHIVKQYPQLLHAYIAISPVINMTESEKLTLALVKDYAQKNNNNEALHELNSVKIPFETVEDLFYIRKWLFISEGREFAKQDSFKPMFFDLAKRFFPVLKEVMNEDLNKSLPDIKCPVYFFVSPKDHISFYSVSEHYFKNVNADKKELFWFKDSGHNIINAEPEKFQNIILNDILK